MTPETFFENFAYLADAPNGVQKLRELILQLAVRGKLVPQDSNDEPAAKLLERIRAEKARLVKEKKIRKADPLPPVTDDEAPYELPQGWAWVRLRDVTRDCGQKVPDKRFTYIDVSAIDNAKGAIASPTEMNPEEAPSRARKLVEPGTVIYSTVRPYLLNIAVIEESIDPEPIASTAFAILHPLAGVSEKYMFWWLRSPDFITYVESKMLGVAYPAINDTQFFTGPFPLAPVAEQLRIIRKVDQLMALCDELEARQQKSQQKLLRLNNAALDRLTSVREADHFTAAWRLVRDSFDLLYTTPETIAKLRQSILQLAVQGKLVPQDPNEEPASKLLERIRAEKVRLVIEKRIRRVDPLPSVTAEEEPFRLPQGWEWTRFPELGEFGRGKSKHRPRNDPSLYKDGTYPLVQTGDVARANPQITTYTGLYNEKGLAQSRLWPKGTMCITIAANIADTGFLGFDACFPDSVVGFIPSNEVGDVRYFEYFMRTAKGHLTDFAPSTAQKNINLEILGQVLIPLPPLRELRRIVAKVDQLMALCDDLEARLKKARMKAEILTAAAVQGLVAA